MPCTIVRRVLLRALTRGARGLAAAAAQAPFGPVLRTRLLRWYSAGLAAAAKWRGIEFFRYDSVLIRILLACLYFF